MADRLHTSRVITINNIKEKLSYNPETGIFVWKKRRMGPKTNSLPGSIAGYQHDNRGYIRIKLWGKSYYCHRLAWLYMTGEWPEKHIDHADGNTLNNKWSNLRAADKSQNGANKRLLANRTGLKGVTFDARRGLWRSRIHVRWKEIHLGRYDCPAAAHFAYLVAADKHFGEFARAR